MQKGPPTKGLVYDPLKERIDRFALSQVIFDDFNFTAQRLDTVIKLLKSPEETLVIKALRHLDRFAMTYIGHYEVLYNAQIIGPLYGHLGDGHLYRRRFAWKLLSQIFVVPAAQLEIMENDEVFKGAVETFGKVFFLNIYGSFCKINTIPGCRQFLNGIYRNSSQSLDDQLFSISGSSY